MSCLRGASILLFICIICTSFVGNSGERSLSRRKRYVVFPEGSSFSIALCMTIHTLTSDNIFTEGLNWGISYDLPNESKPALEPFLELRKDPSKKYDKIDKYSSIESNHGWNYDKKYRYPMGMKKKYYKPDYNYIKRRHRRDLYNKLEIIMNAMNFDGRSCILRALCEASQRLMPKGNTLVEEMMRIAFTLPLTRVFSYEPQEHRTYVNAHQAGNEGQNCASKFAGCTFSLIDMALGKYSDNEGKSNVQSDRRDIDDYRGEMDGDIENYDVTSKTSTPVRYSMK